MDLKPSTITRLPFPTKYSNQSHSQDPIESVTSKVASELHLSPHEHCLHNTVKSRRVLWGTEPRWRGSLYYNVGFTMAAWRQEEHRIPLPSGRGLEALAVFTWLWRHGNPQEKDFGSECSLKSWRNCSLMSVHNDNPHTLFPQKGTPNFPSSIFLQYPPTQTATHWMMPCPHLSGSFPHPVRHYPTCQRFLEIPLQTHTGSFQHIT